MVLPNQFNTFPSFFLWLIILYTMLHMSTTKCPTAFTDFSHGLSLFLVLFRSSSRSGKHCLWFRSRGWGGPSFSPRGPHHILHRKHPSGTKDPSQVCALHKEAVIGGEILMDNSSLNSWPSLIPALSLHEYSKTDLTSVVVFGVSGLYWPCPYLVFLSFTVLALIWCFCPLLALPLFGVSVLYRPCPYLCHALALHLPLTPNLGPSEEVVLLCPCSLL